MSTFTLLPDDTTPAHDGTTLTRIRRGRGKRRGGFIGDDVVLENGGWVDGTSHVSGRSRIAGHGLVDEQARVHNALVAGSGYVTDSARVTDAIIDGHARVSGCAVVLGPGTRITGTTAVSGAAHIGPSTVLDGPRVSGSAKVARVTIIGTATLAARAHVVAPAPLRYIDPQDRPHIFGTALIESAGDVFISPPLGDRGTSLVAYRTHLGVAYSFGSDPVTDPFAVLSSLGRTRLVTDTTTHLRRWLLRRRG